MKCTKCAADLADGSKYCNQCGSAQEGAPGPGAPPIPAAVKPADEPEQPVWKGGVSAKAFGHWWLLYVLWIAGVSYLAYLVLTKYDYSWLRWVFLGIFSFPALWIGWVTMFAKLTTRYRLTTHRFFKETGFISRKLAELELIRIDDVQVTQNLIQRLFNVGRVTLITTDATDPRLEIDGIENPVEVKENIRTNVRKRRGKAIHMESL
jgi:membrane protein YdbS with pleckstrin-like domain